MDLNPYPPCTAKYLLIFPTRKTGSKSLYLLYKRNIKDFKKKTVYVKKTNKTCFKQNRDTAPTKIIFVFMKQNLVSGLNNGIALMDKDPEPEQIIPSNLTYAPQIPGIISPYPFLVYVIKMYKIKLKSD